MKTKACIDEQELTPEAKARLEKYFQAMEWRKLDLRDKRRGVISNSSLAHRRGLFDHLPADEPEQETSKASKTTESKKTGKSSKTTKIKKKVRPI